MTSPAGTPHLNDGDLLLYLEGEADAAVPAPILAHLRSCGVCGRRAEQIRRRSEALDARLAELDQAPAETLLPGSFEEVRRRRAARPPGRPAGVYSLRRAAVIVAVLLSGALLVQPVRALVLHWADAGWRGVAGMLGGGGEAPAGEAVRPAPEPAQQTEYRFTPEGSELWLEIASAQAEGAVAIRVTGEWSAVLEVNGSGGTRDPVWMLPDRVEIRNSPGGTGSYRLSVPSTVRVLHIRIGGEPWSALRTGDFRPGEERILPLREGR